MEVIQNPSFKEDDKNFEMKLLEDTITLIDIKPKQPKKTKGKVYQKLKFMDQLLEKKQKLMIKRDLFESENLGGYTKIYPEPNLNEYYGKILSAAETMWQGFSNIRKTPIQEERGRVRGVKSSSFQKSRIILKNNKPLYYVKDKSGKSMQEKSNIENDYEMNYEELPNESGDIKRTSHSLNKRILILINHSGHGKKFCVMGKC